MSIWHKSTFLGNLVTFTRRSHIRLFFIIKIFFSQTSSNWSLLEQRLLLYLPTQIRFLIVGEGVMCPWSKLHNALGQTNLHNSLGQQQLKLESDQVVHFWNRGKFICQPRQANNFYAVVAAKRFQKRTEEEIEQLLHHKSSKSTNKAPTMPWERWETSAKSKIWANASKNLTKQALFPYSGNFATNL